MIGFSVLSMGNNLPEAVIITPFGTTATKEDWSRQAFIVSDIHLRKNGRQWAGQ